MAVRTDASSHVSLPASPTVAVASVPGRIEEVEALVEAIASLWGHLNAATARFLQLIAEFDRIEGWSVEGCANCAHWLNLKCGIGSVAAREKVRVARALENLPQIADAFRHGRVSYSKVRALTRVATAENEETLLNVALFGTASQVEKLVRHYRRVERIEEAEAAIGAHRSRYLSMHHDDDGMWVLHARLPAEVGAVVKQAIEAAMAALDESDGHDATETAGDVSAETRSDSGADVSAETSAETEARSEVDDPAGARRADGLAHLAAAFLNTQAIRNPSTGSRYQVVVRIDQCILTRQPGSERPPDAVRHTGNAFPPATCGPVCCEIDDGPTLARDTARRLSCDATLVGLVHGADGNPLNVGRRTRAISPALARALEDRDGGCRFPGCDRRLHTEGHHIRHWADAGETKLSNLITLCSFHHRLLHEGGYGLVATDDGAFVFTRPDGRRITTALAGSRRRFSGNIAELNARQHIEIEKPPGWHGETMDYGLAVEALLAARAQTSCTIPSGPSPGTAAASSG